MASDIKDILVPSEIEDDDSNGRPTVEAHKIEYYPCGSKKVYHHCQDCVYKTTKKAHLENHKRKQHAKPVEPSLDVQRDIDMSAKPAGKDIPPKNSSLWFKLCPFACSLCNYRCTSSQTLKDHEAKHFVKSQHQCSHCGYGADNAAHLGRHMTNGHYNTAEDNLETSQVKYSLQCLNWIDLNYSF